MKLSQCESGRSISGYCGETGGSGLPIALFAKTNTILGHGFNDLCIVLLRNCVEAFVHWLTWFHPEGEPFWHRLTSEAFWDSGATASIYKLVSKYKGTEALRHLLLQATSWGSALFVCILSFQLYPDVRLEKFVVVDHHSLSNRLFIKYFSFLKISLIINNHQFLAKCQTLWEK